MAKLWLAEYINNFASISLANSGYYTKSSNIHLIDSSNSILEYIGIIIFN